MSRLLSDAIWPGPGPASNTGMGCSQAEAASRAQPARSDCASSRPPCLFAAPLLGNEREQRGLRTSRWLPARLARPRRPPAPAGPACQNPFSPPAAAAAPLPWRCAWATPVPARSAGPPAWRVGASRRRSTPRAERLSAAGSGHGTAGPAAGPARCRVKIFRRDRKRHRGGRLGIRVIGGFGRAVGPRRPWLLWADGAGHGLRVSRTSGAGGPPPSQVGKGVSRPRRCSRKDDADRGAPLPAV